MRRRRKTRRKRIHVKAYSYLRRIKGRKRRKRITISGRYYFQKVRLPKPKKVKKRKPKKIRERKPKPKPKPKKVRKPVPKPKPKRRVWLSVSEYIDRLDHEASKDRSEYETSKWRFHDGKKIRGSRKILETRDLVYRDHPDKDFIALPEKFIWFKKLRSLTNKTLDLFHVSIIRVWVKAYDSSRKKYIIFSRTRSFGRPGAVHGQRFGVKTFTEAEEWAKDILGSVVDSMSSYDYMEVQDIVAWTVWGPQKKRTW